MPVTVPHGAHPLDYLKEHREKEIDRIKQSANELEEERKAIAQRRKDDELRLKQIEAEQVQKRQQVQAIKENSHIDPDKEKKILDDEEVAVKDLINHYLARKTIFQKREFCSWVAAEHDPLYTLQFWQDPLESCLEPEQNYELQLDLPKPKIVNTVKKEQPKQSCWDVMCCRVPEVEMEAINASQQQPLTTYEEYHLKLSNLKMVAKKRDG
jgi:hypothetical protein